MSMKAVSSFVSNEKSVLVEWFTENDQYSERGPLSLWVLSLGSKQFARKSFSF